MDKEKDEMENGNSDVKGNVDSNDSKNEEEEKELMTFVNEIESRLELKKKQRRENEKSKIVYPDESFFVKLDSSIKKNSAFVKKLKNITETQREQIFKDMNSLNLTKYISEVASAIVEAKLKMSEIPMVIQLCSALHQRYSEFSPQLLEAWSKNLPKKSSDSINSSKMRIDLRLFAELISSGVFPPKEGLQALGNLLILLTDKDKETHNNLNIILSFCRHCGDDYAGFLPRKYRLLSEKYSVKIPKSDFLPSDRQKAVNVLLRDYYKSLCTHVVNDHKTLKKQEKQIIKSLKMKGEVSKEKKEKFEASQLDWQKLWSSTQQFADILDQDLPELPLDTLDAEDNEELNLMNFDVSNRFKGQPEFEASSLWEDEDTRTFYQQILDLKSIIPSILYKDSVKEEEIKEEKANTEDELKKDDKLTASEAEDIENEDVGEELEVLVDVNEVEEAEASDEETNKDSGEKPSNKILMDAFLNTLENCVNRDMIDKSAVNFCTNLNTKNNRKKLAKALFTVPRTRLDLLPFYARFVAQVAPVMPQVATDLVNYLKQDFRFLFKKKDQINIESKVKNVRFIGELVKFEIFPKADALHFLKLLLSDFRHHHIEMTCHLLETCGRYLYRSHESHLRAKILLDQMMRKKALLPFDSRYITTIENAYYFANPPETQSISRVERSPIHEYIRKLLYNDLNKTTLEKVLRQLRKLNWDDAEISSYVIKCLINIWNVKFLNIRWVAYVLAQLNTYQEWVPPKVIDGVLEEIRLGMDINHPKYNQNRVAMVRYLGELYNHHLIESSIIFKTLYSLIYFGVTYDHNIYSELDPPDNLIRIKLVCYLLEICGQYFSSGTSKKRLDYFLYFFQKYYWFKKSNAIYTDDYPFPFSIDHLFKEVVATIRPKFKFVNSYENSIKALDDIVNELKSKLKEVCPNINLDANSIDVKTENDNSILNPIEEADEEVDSEAQEFSYHETGSEDEFGGRLDKNLEFGQKTTSDEGSEGEVSPFETNFTRRRNKPKSVEDDQFEKEFERLMSESLIARSQDVIRTNTDISIPTHRSEKKVVAFSDGIIVQPEKEPTVHLTLMMRTKGKPLLKPIDVPVDSELAKSLKSKEEKIKAEQQIIKDLTLDINKRREMEDRDAELERGYTNQSANTTKDSKKRFNQPNQKSFKH